MELILRAFKRNYCKCGIPPLKGKTYSLVVLGRCNFRCKFCFEGGNNIDKSGILPNSNEVSMGDIERFIKEEVKRGNLLKITGGEPTLFSDEVVYLLKRIKEVGGYSSVDTNGSNPEVCERFAKYANAIGLDIKSDKERIRYLTGRPYNICWDRPIETLLRAKKFRCIVQVRTVLFDFSNIEFLDFIYNLIPPHAYWELKQYLTPKVKIHKFFTPASKKRILSFMKTLCKKYPSLNKRILAIIGSSQNIKNFYYPH